MPHYPSRCAKITPSQTGDLGLAPDSHGRGAEINTRIAHHGLTCTNAGQAARVLRGHFKIMGHLWGRPTRTDRKTALSEVVVTLNIRTWFLSRAARRRIARYLAAR